MNICNLQNILRRIIIPTQLRKDASHTARIVSVCVPRDNSRIKLFRLPVLVVIDIADLIDPDKLFIAEVGVTDNLHIVNNLFRPRGSDQHRADMLILEDPCKCHFGKRLPSFAGERMERCDLTEPFLREI